MGGSYLKAEEAGAKEEEEATQTVQWEEEPILQRLGGRGGQVLGLT